MSARLYHSTQIRECEKKAMEDLGLSSADLMKRAGKEALYALRKLFPQAKRLLIFCGSGNNAGDGYVLAKLAQTHGYTVHINQYKLPQQLPPAACAAALVAQQAGISCQNIIDPEEFEADVIVDALLGTGLQGQVKEPLFSAINLMNASRLPILSLDVPSGLEADTGLVLGTAVKALATVTFIAPKLGLFTLDGPDYCGEVFCHTLGLDTLIETIIPRATCLHTYKLPKRPLNAHKHQFGHVLVIGANEGMLGAVRLAAYAALRVGAGLVTMAVHPSHAQQAFCGLSEVMAYGIENANDLLPLLEQASVCVIGPGLGQDQWAKALFNQVLSTHLPTVIDAGGLRLLANTPQRDDNWILTPHPGEAAALLGCTTKRIQEDRFQSITDLQNLFGGVIVLKGRGSLIQTDTGKTFLCNAGNPGMASAGMGDVLSGIIAGLVAQRWDLDEAAKMGVWFHATAGDAAAKAQGERGLLASDLYPFLQELVN